MSILAWSLAWSLVGTGVLGIWLIAITVILRFMRISKSEDAYMEQQLDRKHFEELISVLSEEELIRIGHRFKLKGNMSMSRFLADYLLSRRKARK